MAYDKIAAKLMSMSEDVWIRHANPWSGWTRVAMFPFWFNAIWSWTWIGWWVLFPAAILAIWTWLNPPPYRDDQSWITRGVLGERIFMNRQVIAIPPEHLIAAHLLSPLAFVGLSVPLWGSFDQLLAGTGGLAAGYHLQAVVC